MEYNPPQLKTAQMCDLPAVTELYRRVIETMNQSGLYQWDLNYPDAGVHENDIRKGDLLLWKTNAALFSCAVMNRECEEDDYQTGNWSSQEADYAVIHRLCVNPDMQGCGIATAMILALEKRAFRSGTTAIRLDTFSENTIAVHLYEKLGYRRVGEMNWEKGVFYLFEKILV